MNYIDNFKSLGFGLFVHFGLYSVNKQGEWAKCSRSIPDEKYGKLPGKFNPKKTWAKDLVKMAKKAGCKYITLTTRHHDGFSLYDTKGLNDYDSLHSKCGRDLVKEFTDECNKEGIMPVFYHTLLDWYNPDYKDNFPKYIDYLIDSLTILCTNYGKVGGFWFDGMWDKPNEDWQEDRIYATLRKYQPEAMIINNTGLSELGKVGHPEIDSVTFERGKPRFVDNSDRDRAGEMCQVLCDHWGYAVEDINYKAFKDILDDLIDCRRYGCNFLLNVGPTGNGSLRTIDKCYLEMIGQWIRKNKNFIYGIKPCDVKAENAEIVYDGNYYYAIVKDVPMAADPNVQRAIAQKLIKVNANISNAIWLDNGKRIKIKNNSFGVETFLYGTSYCVRIARFTIK